MAIKKEDLEEYRDCNAKRLKLEREAKTLKARCDQLSEQFAFDLTASRKQSVIRHGFTLAWIAGRATVAWADAYLRECGPDKAAALKAEAAKSVTQKLSITVPA